MALKIEWSELASKDLDEIIEYLEGNWTEREIRKFFHRLEECLGNISSAPNLAKDSIRKTGTKEYQHSQKTTIFICLKVNTSTFYKYG